MSKRFISLFWFVIYKLRNIQVGFLDKNRTKTGPSPKCFVLLQVSKCFVLVQIFGASPKIWLHSVPLQRLLCRHKNQFYWMQITILSGTKPLWLLQYVNKFLVWHKKSTTPKHFATCKRTRHLGLGPILVLFLSQKPTCMFHRLQITNQNKLINYFEIILD